MTNMAGATAHLIQPISARHVALRPGHVRQSSSVYTMPCGPTSLKIDYSRCVYLCVQLDPCQNVRASVTSISHASLVCVPFVVCLYSQGFLKARITRDSHPSFIIDSRQTICSTRANASVVTGQLIKSQHVLSKFMSLR